MPARDDLVRLATLAASLQKMTGTLPRSTPEDARRCVRFACRCVVNAEGLPPLFIAFGLPELRDGFELAARWSEGEDVSGEQLRAAWDFTKGRAGTISTKLSGAAAAHWAIVYAIEAAMEAALAGNNSDKFDKVAKAAEASAKYARLAHGAHTAAQAVEYQTSLIAEIFKS